MKAFSYCPTDFTSSELIGLVRETFGNEQIFMQHNMNILLPAINIFQKINFDEEKDISNGDLLMGTLMILRHSKDYEQIIELTKERIRG